jgi:hypothetical protein
MAKTILKKEDWGGLTIVALLAAYVFPPYFIYLMTMAALTEFAHLWTTKLSREEKDRFIEFEKEFRKGYKLQKEGKTKAALAWYHQLEMRYADLPQGAKLATLQIRQLTGNKNPPEKKASTKSKKQGRS